MSKEFIIRQIDEDKDLKHYSEQGWAVKQVITHEVVHNKVKGIKWDRYHILFERDNERGQAHHWKKLLKNYDYQLIENAVDKLGELEDIEDELGIELTVLFKGLKSNKIFIKANYNGESIMPCNSFDLVFNGFVGYHLYCRYGVVNECHEYCKLKDYGKTWALTEEGLEK